jgi:hypothetical protein
MKLHAMEVESIMCNDNFKDSFLESTKVPLHLGKVNRSKLQERGETIK